jgi:DNA mismatch repair ATPase MutS
VLAQMGAPVRAAALTVSPLALGSSIRVDDSLQEGSSRFYAEITRLRQVMDLAGSPPPLLFLLDEILHGTNSSDRAVGAEAVIRGALELMRAVGLEV